MNLIKNNRGVSVLELLVSIALFSFLMLSSIQIFKMVVDGQRSSISAQNVQENMRYAMEKIGKEIRTAWISDDNCEAIFSPPVPTAVYKIFNTVDDDSKLYFKNQYGYCAVYYLENNRLKIMTDSAAGFVSGFITPEKIEISNLKFYIVDDLIGAFHSTQPYVVIAMDVEATGQAIHKQKMKIQITVSSRYYE